MNKRSLTLALVWTACVGCGWKHSFEFISPDGTKRIELFNRHIDAPRGLRIDFVQSGQRSTLLETGESYIGFIHVYWATTRPVAGLLVCGTRELRIAFRTDSRMQIPFTSVEDDLNSDVMKKYGSDPGQNYLPSKCIGTYYGDAFLKKFPRINF